MTTIKKTKTFKLLLLLALLSISFTSCSPTDELSEEVVNVDEVDEIETRGTYDKTFFMMTGTYYYFGYTNPKYDLVRVSFYSDTDEFVQIEEVLKSHEELMIQASEEGWERYKFVSTRVFVEYNVIYYTSGGIPLMINPDYETTEFQLDLHLSENIEAYVRAIIDPTSIDSTIFAERIEMFRNRDLVFYQ